RVTGTDGSILTGHDGGINLQAARRNNVATFAVCIADQCDVRATVRVVFQALDTRGNVVLVATEIHNAVMLLVTTATMTHRDVAIVVTARAAAFLFKQACKRSTLVKFRVHDLDHATTCGRGWFDFYECHLVLL